jgi:hypothetical protein
VAGIPPQLHVRGNLTNKANKASLDGKADDAIKSNVPIEANDAQDR